MKFQKTVQVINKLGLHARASAELVKIATNYKSDIHLNLEGQSVDGKNIMGIMMLAASKGTLLTFNVNSSENEKFKKEMSELFSSKFQDE